MRIDAHHHLWNYDPERDGWITDDMRAIRTDFTPYDLLRELKANAMDGSVVVQADPSETETAFLVDIANRHDFVRGVVGWIDLCSPSVANRLQFYKQTAPKVKGFRHIVQSEPDDRFMLREDFCRGMALLRQHDYTYDILIYPRQLPAALELVARFPEQPFVIDHLAKPNIRGSVMKPWAEQMQALAAHPNVWCKVSGMVTEANWAHWRQEDFVPYLDVIFQAFGPDRLLFGSDWPVCLVAATYAEVLQILMDYMAKQGSEVIDGVMGENAKRFYHLQ